MSAVVAEQRSVHAARPVSTVFARRGVLAALAVTGLLVAVGGALLVATSDHLVDPIAWGVQIGVMILGAVAASLTWLARRPGNRVGFILLALAVTTAILSLQGATQPLLHGLGVAVEPVFFLLAYYAVFAFPDGRLGGWFEKALLAGMTLYFLTGFVPYLFFSPVVGGGAPLAGCTADCPTNALMIADRPTIAASYGSDGSYLVIAIMSATLACLLYRVATATRPRRRALLPVYVPAVVLTVPLLIFHGVVTQLLHLEASTIWDVGWFVTVARCALPFGFLLAIVQTTFFAATALKAIVGRLVENPNAAQLRQVLADALDDPDARVRPSGRGNQHVRRLAWAAGHHDTAGGSFVDAAGPKRRDGSDHRPRRCPRLRPGARGDRRSGAAPRTRERSSSHRARLDERRASCLPGTDRRGGRCRAPPGRT